MGVRNVFMYIYFIIFLYSCKSISQDKVTIQTKIVWAEDLIHYKKGYDTFLKKGNLVSFLKTTDSLPSITKKTMRMVIMNMVYFARNF